MWSIKGDLSAAELLYREALQVYRETLGDWHPVTFMSINHLGRLLKDKAKQGRACLTAVETTDYA